MGVFSGIKEAQANKGGVYLQPGNYTVELQAVKSVLSRKKDDLFIVEMKVVDSAGEGANAVDSNASWIANLTKHDAAMGNIKSFIMAVGDLEEADVTEALLDEAVEEKNPHKGELVNVQVALIKTQAGGDFSLHKWFPYSE